MVGDSGSVIVFNGEIYNYRELQAELAARGCIFRTSSDTEVLLKCYETWGTDCLSRLNGMFAFAIWDPRQRHLFLARDRLGKKPLYYAEASGIFAFASELKALLALPQVGADATIDEQAISDYLSLGYIITPKTIFRGIRRLPAGHYALVIPENGLVACRDYWRLHDVFRRTKRPYDREAQEQFLDLFQDAVRIRLRSDVPLGVFLSGGMDSSAVVATMKALSESPTHAFCAGFLEPSFDESPFAKLVAKRLDVDLTVFEAAPVTPRELARLVWHADEPFADTSIMPTFQLNHRTRQKVKVALSGDGGDELLAGYPTHVADQLYGFYARIPARLQAWIESMCLAWMPRSGRKVAWDYKLRQFVRSRGLSPHRAHYWWRVVFSDEEKRAILSPVALARLGAYDPFSTFEGYFDQVGGVSFLDQTTYVDIKTWLQDDILVKADRMSMAHGLEVRSPFLDYRLVEFCATLPDHAKLSWFKQKRILKDCFGKALPSEILRRPKRGFNAPTRQFDSGVLNARGFSGLLCDDFSLDPRTGDTTFKSFAIAVLDLWLEMFQQFQRTGEWKEVVP